MKQKRSFKRLFFNKETIANLDLEKMEDIKGGWTGTTLTICTFCCDGLSWIIDCDTDPEY